MDRRILFTAWIYTLLAESFATRSAITDLHKALSSEIKTELIQYVGKLHEDFQNDIMGERWHERHDFRVLLLPKSHQCYYQAADNQTLIVINYESGSSPSIMSSGIVSAVVFFIENGEDIGDGVTTKEEATSGEIEIEVEKKGTYGICFPNKDSKNPAILQIQIDIWKRGEMYFHDELQKTTDPLLGPKLILLQIARSVALVRHSIMHTQSLLYSDYHTQSSNQSRVNNFSLFSFLLITSVCFIQLRIVKKMFGQQSSSV